jgi:hypothetical protein
MKTSKKSVIAQITKVRMQQELKDKLTRSAKLNKRTQNGELVYRLELSFAKEEEEARASVVDVMLEALAPKTKGNDGKQVIDTDKLAKLFAETLQGRDHVKAVSDLWGEKPPNLSLLERPRAAFADSRKIVGEVKRDLEKTGPAETIAKVKEIIAALQRDLAALENIPAPEGNE